MNKEMVTLPAGSYTSSVGFAATFPSRGRLRWWGAVIVTPEIFRCAQNGKFLGAERLRSVEGDAPYGSAMT